MAFRSVYRLSVNAIKQGNLAQPKSGLRPPQRHTIKIKNTKAVRVILQI